MLLSNLLEFSTSTIEQPEKPVERI